MSMVVLIYAERIILTQKENLHSLWMEFVKWHSDNACQANCLLSIRPETKRCRCQGLHWIGQSEYWLIGFCNLITTNLHQCWLKLPTRPISPLVNSKERELIYHFLMPNGPNMPHDLVWPLVPTTSIRTPLILSRPPAITFRHHSMWPSLKMLGFGKRSIKRDHLRGQRRQAWEL